MLSSSACGTRLAHPHRDGERRMSARCVVREQTMAQESLETRMDRLKRRVEILEQLPERVTALESQIVLLRDEMRSEFSALRTETGAGDEQVIKTLGEEIRAGDEQVIKTLREEIRAGDEQVIKTLREEIRAGDEQVIKTLREEIRAGDGETQRVLTARMESLFEANQRHMRLLHEDLVERIARSSEGR
jgi:hypothetical protein